MLAELLSTVLQTLEIGLRQPSAGNESWCLNMVQIGNFHIGKAESAADPTVDITEASILWEMLVARYKCIEETQLYLNYVKDADFKVFISKVGLPMLERQANELEKQMDIYKIPLPKRPPKSVNIEDGSMAFSDELMFARIFEGCQGFIENIGYFIRTTVTNDPLRNIFYSFFKEETDMFDAMCKYGKQKGWLQVRPLYKPH